MDSAHLKNAKAAAYIQYAVSLLQCDIIAILKKKNLARTNKMDFNNCLQDVQKNVKKFLSDLDSQKMLLGTLNRAREIRNRYSHHDFDANRFEHDMECLLKLASLMGLNECREKIMEFVGTVANEWEKLKAEGNEHYKSGRWAEAMDCYTKAIRVNAKVPVLYSNRALCEMQLAKFDLAREDTEDAIELDPKQVKFYRILSDALFRLELFQEALSACEDGLKLDPRDEVLILRVRDCKAYITDKKIKSHPIAGGIEQMMNPELCKKLCDQHMKDLFESDATPDEVGLVDRVNMETALEINKAHRIFQPNKDSLEAQREAFKIFESAAKRGSAEGLYNMAIMHKDGMAGLTCDSKKYLELCHKAVEQKPFLKFHFGAIFPNIGVAEAENSIAMAYRDGLTVDRDEKVAFKWFLKSARHGCPSAMNNLGLALRNGAGCEINLKSARWWLQRSADRGQSEALVNLAGMLENGEGGPIDAPKAVELLKAAADQGFPDALLEMQRLMRSGASGVGPLNESKNLVQRRADSDEKEALFVMGINYMLGEGGFVQDFAEAEKYLRKASDMSHERAVFVLGLVLLHQRKDKDAVQFIRRAAESGNKDAQQILGQLLAFGHACERDEIQARRWLLRSNEKPDSVDDLIKLGATITDFEATNKLSQSGLTCPERIERFMVSFAPSEIIKKSLEEVLKLFNPNQLALLHPAHSVCNSKLEKTMPLMANRAAQGSKTARKFFYALNLLNKACLALESKKPADAFRLYRQAERTWQPLPVSTFIWSKLSAAAEEAFESNPNDADALFVLLHYKSASKLYSTAELLRMALHCTTLNPRVADYHSLLGNLYGFNGDYISSGKSIDRALELEPEPEWLYNKATSLRLQCSEDHQAVINAYEQYIKSSEPDSRQVPKAWYCIAMEHIAMHDRTKAREYFQKGLQAEHPDVRLPYFEPEDDFPPKKILRVLFSLGAM